MSAVPQPTTAQLVEAMVAALAPLAGPYGLAASSILAAGTSLYGALVASGKTTVTMDDLLVLQAKATADLAQLQADNLAAGNPAP